MRPTYQHKLFFALNSLVSWYPFSFRQGTPNSRIAPDSAICPLYGFDLEMQRYEREHQSLQILHKIVEHTKTFGVCRFGDIDKRANLGRLQLTSVGGFD